MASTTKKRKKPTSSAKKKAKKSGGKINKKAVIALIICSVITLALILTVFFVRGNNPRRTPAPLSGDKVWGIDISSHNGKINWEKAGKKAKFAFIRVGYRGYTEGEINADTKAKYNLKHAIKNGVPVGVYFYSQAIDEKEAEEEAEFVLKAIKGYNVTLPVVIDFEYAMNGGNHTGRLYDARLNRKERTALINAFCDKVRDAGYTPGIYASSYIYRTELIMKNIPDDVFIWVADYNGRVTYGGYYDIWQYSETGNCEGISTYVDTNYFYIKNRVE